MDTTHESNGTIPLVVRVPVELIHRTDDLAKRAGLTRSQLVRMVLGRVNADDIPRAMFDNADALRPVRHAAM